LTPGIWGAFSAASWGLSDFFARLTGRAAGYLDALLGVLFLGTAFLSLWLVLARISLVWTASSAGLLVFAGVCSLIGYVTLYWSFTRGPVSVAAPIAGSYPALVVIIAVVLGSRPTALQWLGAAVTFIGVVIVARGGVEAASPLADVEMPVPAATPAAPASHSRPAAASMSGPSGPVWARLIPSGGHTVAAAFVSSLSWAAMISATQRVAPVVGNVQTIWLPRLVAFVLLSLFVAASCLRGRARPSIPGRWWPVIAAQAGLDVVGYYTLYAAATGPNPEIAAMASSAYYVVTVVFGRIFLKERIGLVQAGGIALVLGGVVLLSA
jgi:drug/metabolite transporter (DMT)-like permease